MRQVNDQLIEKIQRSGHASVWIVTGGAIGAVRSMLVHPGASRFVADVRIPYSAAALKNTLGATLESACSENTARLMAAKALEGGTLGVACTAALRTNRSRAGADRAHVCFQTADRVFHERIDLEPAERSEQDAALSERLLVSLARFLEEAS